LKYRTAATTTNNEKVAIKLNRSFSEEMFTILHFWGNSIQKQDFLYKAFSCRRLQGKRKQGKIKKSRRILTLSVYAR